MFRNLLQITKWDSVYSYTQICFEGRNQQNMPTKMAA